MAAGPPPRDAEPGGVPTRRARSRAGRAGTAPCERLLVKAFIPFAVALTAISPAVVAVTAGSAGPARGAPGSAAAAPAAASYAQLDETHLRVRRLTDRARAHSRRLGLRARIDGAPSRPRLLARRERRLVSVVGFLAARREVERPVDERSAPRARVRGRSLAARVRRQHSIAVRHAVRLGVDRPGPLRPASTREGRIGQLAHWRAVAGFLRARRENVRPSERPLSQRVPHYAALMCIAEHESGLRWDISTGNGYHGGLQMDRGFQSTYAPRLYRAKGTADNWTQEEQMRAAARAVRTRGFHPWPTTARMCGLI